MKDLFKSSRFKLIVTIIALLLFGMLLASANGHGETAQSTVIGTIFTPAHWVASKLSEGIDSVIGNATGNAEYEEKIDALQQEIGELQSQLSDYENLKMQNELYKEALELKNENSDFTYEQATVIGRDSADPFDSFTINKGTLDQVSDGNAVLYGKYLVGIIKKAYPTYSVVQTVCDPDFSVSAYDITSNELSYVTGTAELAQEGKCKFENLDSDTKITYGSIIATAGITSAMPRGIIIGTVEELTNEITNISSYAVLQPGTDISKITSCLVVTYFDAESGED